MDALSFDVEVSPPSPSSVLRFLFYIYFFILCYLLLVFIFILDHIFYFCCCCCLLFDFFCPFCPVDSCPFQDKTQLGILKLARPFLTALGILKLAHCPFFQKTPVPLGLIEPGSRVHVSHYFLLV